MDHVYRATRATQPDALELRTVVHPPHAGIAPRRGIVDDRIAGRVEANDDHQVAVGAAVEQEASQLARARGDGGDQRDTSVHELLRLG